MRQLRECPFCGAPVNLTSDGDIFGWHDSECFFQMLDEDNEFDMTEDEMTEAFVRAWNRRADNG